MDKISVRPSPYRWIILAVFMFITMTVEIQWLTHAAVARPAEVFYQGQFSPSSFFNIDFLAMSYMVMFLIMSFPASYIIDTYGIRKALRFGAALAGISSAGKALFAGSFAGVVISHVGLAIAQPFILNAVTAVTVRWFPLNERGMAAGFSALAQYIGIIIAMLVTPFLVGSDPSLAGYGSGFENMLRIYGIVTLASAITVFVFIREKPEHELSAGSAERYDFRHGVFQILKNRDMQITLLLFLVGLGIFNAISSMTDSISEYAGVSDSDGLIGGLMLIGGIIGAVLIPVLSDKLRKRKLFLVICLAGMVPGVLGLSFAGNLGLDHSSTYSLLLVSSFILGFFVMSAGPVGFQYAAEVSFPAPESASQGMLLWIGQLSGMIFVAFMSIGNNKYIGSMLALFSVLTFFSLAGVLFLRESRMIRSNTQSSA
jgi:MFS family permease